MPGAHALTRTRATHLMSHIPDLCSAETVYRDCLLTTSGRLLGGFSIAGIDPSSFDEDDHLRLAMATNSIFAGIPEQFSVTQCRMRLPADPVAFAPHRDPLVQQLSQKRESYLSRFPFLQTRTWHFLDHALDDTLKPSSITGIARNAILAPFSANAREGLKNSLSADKTLRLLESDLEQKRHQLDEAIENTMARWSSLTDASRLDGPDILSLLAVFLGSSRPPRPQDIEDLQDIAPLLGDGDVSIVQIGPATCLRLGGAIPHYARVASVTAFGKTRPGHWTQGWDPRVTDLPFPHAMTVRWRKLNQIETALLFEIKRRELQRSSVSIGGLITGMTGGENKPEHLSTKLRKQFDELDQADALDVRWTHSEASFLIWGANEAELTKRCRTLNTACQSIDAKLVWESDNIANAFRATLPTGSSIGLRRMITNSAQNASLALINARASGSRGNEQQEPLDVFPSSDLEPYAFHPWTGGRALTIGIGPTRSGKTFAKNALAIQTLRFDAWYFALDVDAGTEPLAAMLGDRASYFAIGDNSTGSRAGFNLFSSCAGADDIAWRGHFIRQLKRMFRADDGAPPDEAQTRLLDAATEAVLKLPAEQQTLSHFAAHLPPDLSSRLKRWLRADPGFARHDDGPRAWLTDCIQDTFHSQCRFQVFNFAALRDDDTLRAIAYAETFFRITRIFESESDRARPKFLDVDEAHIPLADPEFARWIVKGARTWNKFRVAVSLWSQALHEFTAIQHFEAIRGAAATLMFTANPSMPKDQYEKHLGLSQGETEAIASLIPRRELYVTQREAGISRKVDVRTDAWTELLLRSDPELVAERNALTSEHGLIEGINRLLEQRSSGKIAA